MNGGIPERDIDGDANAIPPVPGLAKYWQVFPSLRQTLFQPNRHAGYADLAVEPQMIKSAILEHEEFAAFRLGISALFEQWRSRNAPRLKGFDVNGQPKRLITEISEDLLETFRSAPLLDPYDVYQHLMDYWADTLQDDAYEIAADGWVARTRRVLEEVKSGARKGELRDRGWTCDLIPKPYIVARYFAAEQAELDSLQAELETVGASLTELTEEHGDEDGPLANVSTKADAQAAYNQALVDVWSEDEPAACSEYTALIEQAEELAIERRSLTDHRHLSALKNNRGTLTLKAVRDRLANTSDAAEQYTLSRYLEVDQQQKVKARKASALLGKADAHYRRRLQADPLPEALAELHATARYLELLDEQSALRAKVKEADEALDQLAHDQYPQLSVAETKTLVVNDKWLTALEQAVHGELERVSQTLTGRVRQLAERYATPLPQLTDHVAELSRRVNEHLRKMEAEW